jgi:hypothetical protein
MQLGKIILIVLLCCSGFFSSAQDTGSIRGTLTSKAGEAVPSLTVRLQPTTLGATSDMAGVFSIKNVAAGTYTLLITGLGYRPVQRPVTVAAGQETVVALAVEEVAVNMADVTVLGRTEAQEVNRQAFNVTAIDATKLYNTTLDVAGVLDRVAGVRVRESGGVGSNFNLSINGFAGNQVRYFIDGIPMEGFGSSFQINNIPINTAERIEVYKGGGAYLVRLRCAGWGCQYHHRRPLPQLPRCIVFVWLVQHAPHYGERRGNVEKRPYFPNQRLSELLRQRLPGGGRCSRY